MPIVVGGATCILAAGILYTVYVLQYPLLSTVTRSRRKAKTRKRHLDIDIDLSNPLGTPIPIQPPPLHHHHHLHNTDELLNAALSGSVAPQIQLVGPGVGGVGGGPQLANPAQSMHRLSADIDRDVISSPWDDDNSRTSSVPSSVPLTSDLLNSQGLNGYHTSSNSASMNSVPIITTTSASSASSNYYPPAMMAAAPSAPSVQHLDPNLVRSIVERLLDSAPVEPPIGAFSGAVAGLSGRPAMGGRHPGLAIREDTQLPPFTAQIDHLIHEMRSAKQRGKPLLIEGIPGLGKATALQKWVWEEGQLRPAIYLQLSMVLRRRHGGSSVEDDEDVANALGYGYGSGEDLYTETETENEGVEERVALTVRRDAFKKAVEMALGADPMEASMISLSDSMLGTPTTTHFQGFPDRSATPNGASINSQRGSGSADDNDDDEDDSPYPGLVDTAVLDHIAQALRLIAAKSRHGPTLFVLDDVQLLFRERMALQDRYDGIPELFSWFLRCEGEGILDCVMCSSEKSVVGAIKRLKGFDWTLTLHSVDGVEDEAIIEYLLKEVNPKIKEAPRRFTEDTAAHFVATFNGSLLELDNYLRDVNSNVFMFIRKRERSFLRHLQRHMPHRASRNPVTPPTSRKYGMTTSPPTTSTYDLSTSTLSMSGSLSSSTSPSSGLDRGSLRQYEDELRELFLDIIMKGGVLHVSQLDVGRMALAEALVERNILRWRDRRIRKRETRASMKAGWVPPRPVRVGSGNWYEYRREEEEVVEESGLASPTTSPAKNGAAAAAAAVGAAAAGAAAAVLTSTGLAGG
ncbi:hypothetical protein BC829DRAFT_488787 [Chytridium lagenaria]|nr:hypothetical protein BC829DRAFT_488787 [Chytridium lagenaria]